MTSRGLIVAAAASGTGKTVVTAGLLRALHRLGIAIRPAKAGPDYIDPAFHAAASGSPCINLDSWAMGSDLLDSLVAGGANAELLLIEAAMGLFDGADAAPGRTGAAADLAARYGLPVVLVVDVTGQSQTAAAVVRGLATHDPAVRVAGVILNRVASERHRAFVTKAIERAGFTIFGALPRDEALALPARHLGLVQAAEHADLDARLDRIADLVEQHVNIEAVQSAATALSVTNASRIAALPPPGSRIALARDDAFSFIYPHVVDGWRRANAEIVAFSPLADEPPPDDCDACWLPGGYPELHAGRLAAARAFHDGLRDFARTRPVHGECGGHMALGAWLEDARGTRHRMTGLLGHTTSFARRRLTLGYREARLLADGPLGPKGAVVRGHEFHYSTLAEAGADEPLAALSDAQGTPLGDSGSRRGKVSGSYFHAIARV